VLQIKWTKKALFSFADTLKFWNEHNQSYTYSIKLRKEVRKAEKSICRNPYLGSPSKIENIRYFLVFKHFSIYYRVKSDVIEILSFWDNRRNPEDLEM
jgi:plasmid stabilization system protein ParE